MIHLETEKKTQIQRFEKTQNQKEPNPGLKEAPSSEPQRKLVQDFFFHLFSSLNGKLFTLPFMQKHPRIKKAIQYLLWRPFIFPIQVALHKVWQISVVLFKGFLGLIQRAFIFVIAILIFWWVLQAWIVYVCPLVLGY